MKSLSKGKQRLDFATLPQKSQYAINMNYNSKQELQDRKYQSSRELCCTIHMIMVSHWHI